MKISNTDIISKRFGRLLVCAIAIRNKYGQIVIDCLCDCGNKKNVLKSSLTSGRSKSCGCLQKEKVKKAATKNGMSHTKFYQVWVTMRQRCYNPKATGYKIYGERGIRVDEKWLNQETGFINFHNDMFSVYQVGLTLERKNVNGNYCKENCRWASRKEQSLNRRSNKLITIKGIALTQKEWAEKENVKVSTARGRLKRGWELEKAFTSKV